jgi:hypothetical protein
MNTSATPMCLCVNRSTWGSMLNRPCACKAFPELRTSINSNDIPELELPRSGKGGDTTIHRQVTTGVQIGYDTAPDGVVSEDAINGLPSEFQSSTDDNEGDQSSNDRGFTPVKILFRLRLQKMVPGIIPQPLVRLLTTVKHIR